MANRLLTIIGGSDREPDLQTVARWSGIVARLKAMPKRVRDKHIDDFVRAQLEPLGKTAESIEAPALVAAIAVTARPPGVRG